MEEKNLCSICILKFCLLFLFFRLILFVFLNLCCHLLIVLGYLLFLHDCISYRTIIFIFFFLVGFYLGLPWYCTFNFVNKKYFQNIIKLFYYFLFSLIKYFVDDKFVSKTNQSTLFSKASINTKVING